MPDRHKDLRDAVVTALSYATSKTPMDVSEISKRLPWLLTVQTINVALDDLIASGDVSKERICTDDETRFRDVYWRTPQPEQESDTRPRRLIGDVQSEILAILDPLSEAVGLDANTIHERTTLSTSLGSTRKTLQRLAKLGRIASRVDGVGVKRRATYWGLQGGRIHILPTAPEPDPDTDAAADNQDEDPSVDASIIPSAVEARVVAALKTLRAYCGNQSWGWDDACGYYMQAFERRFIAEPETFYNLYTSLDTLAFAEDVTG